MSQTKVLTNTALKGIMTDAMVYRGSNPDLDTRIPGVYLISNLKIADQLYTYGFLRVMAAGSFASQEYLPHQSATTAPGESWAAARTGDFAKRLWYNGAWGPWVIIKGELAT